MIRRVVEQGVSPQRPAKAPAVDVWQIIKKVSLLVLPCPPAELPVEYVRASPV